MIQSFHRFLLDHLSLEGNMFPHNPHIISQEDHHTPAAAPITQLLGIDAKNVITCLNCHAVRDKENMTHIVDLLYPRGVSWGEHPLRILNHLPSIRQSTINDAVDADFASVLRSSLLRQMTHKATCQTCKQFATFSSRRSIKTKDLPLVLAINVSAYNEDSHAIWVSGRSYSFLQSRVEIQGQVEGVDDPEAAVYRLRVRFRLNERNGTTDYSSGDYCANHLQREAITSSRYYSR